MINALLQPKYSSIGPIPPLTTLSYDDYNHDKLFGQNDMQNTKHFTTITFKKAKNTRDAKKHTKYSTKTTIDRIQNKKLDKAADILIRNRVNIRSTTLNYHIGSKSLSKSKPPKIFNDAIRSKITSNENLGRTIFIKRDYNIKHNCVATTILWYDNSMYNNTIIIMNIKHLKLFRLTYRSKTKHKAYWLADLSQSNLISNLNKNIYIKNNTYDSHKLYKVNLEYYMPKFEEVSGLNVKLPIDLYNIVAAKILDMTFDDNGLQKLEQLLNILCNTPNGNLDNIDKVWWNMQTCWTSFNKNKNLQKNGTKEFTVNCEAITDDTDEIMAVYTIIDGRNVPIIVDLRPKKTNNESNFKDIRDW